MAPSGNPVSSSSAPLKGAGIILLVAGAGLLLDAGQVETARPTVLVLWLFHILLAFLFLLFILPSPSFPRRFGTVWFAVVVLVILGSGALATFLDDQEENGSGIQIEPPLFQTPTDTTGIMTTYVIQPGDTLEAIAAKHRSAFAGVADIQCLAAADLLDANPGTQEAIYERDPLVIPYPSCESTPVGHKPSEETDLFAKWARKFEEAVGEYLNHHDESARQALAEIARGDAQDRFTSIIDGFLEGAFRPFECIGVEVNKYLPGPSGPDSWIVITLAYVPRSYADIRGPRIQRIVIHLGMTFTGAGLVATQILEERAGMIRSPFATTYFCR